MPRLGVIELSQLPPFTVLETISTEAILAARLAQLVSLWNAADPPNAATYDVGNLEFDPIRINQELNTYFELLVRDRVNQAARAVTLAFAVGGDLDAIASRYPGGMPRIGGERDIDYRTRIWLSPNTLSPHGMYESYVFWALNAYASFGDPKLRDAQASNIAGDPHITITIMADGPLNLDGSVFAITTNDLPYDGINAGNMITAYPDPTPTPAQQVNTWTYINDDGRRGLTDVISVGGPKIVNVTYDVGLMLFPGWDEAATMTAAAGALATLLENQRWLGYSHTRSAIDAALMIGGVFDVLVNSPSADVMIDLKSTIVVNSIRLYYAGRGGLAGLTSN